MEEARVVRQTEGERVSLRDRAVNTWGDEDVAVRGSCSGLAQIYEQEI